MGYQENGPAPVARSAGQSDEFHTDNIEDNGGNIKPTTDYANLWYTNKAWWKGAFEECARQHEARGTLTRGTHKRLNCTIPEKPCLSMDRRWPILERIDFAEFHGRPLQIHDLDLLRLWDLELAIVLGDVPMLIVADVLTGQYIRDAFAAVGEVPPPIQVEVCDG